MDRDYLLRRAFALAKRYHLTRQERVEYAVAVTGADVESWKELTDQQLIKIIVGMEAAAFLLKILGDRKRASRASAGEYRP